MEKGTSVAKKNEKMSEKGKKGHEGKKGAAGRKKTV